MIKFRNAWIDREDFVDQRARCSFGLLEVGIPALVAGAGELFGGAASALGLGAADAAGVGALGFGAADAAEAGLGAAEAGGLFGGAEGLGALGFGADAAGGLGGLDSLFGGLFGEGGAFSGFGAGEAGALGGGEAALAPVAETAVGPSASAFAAPEAVAGATVPDATSVAAGAGQSLDQLAVNTAANGVAPASGAPLSITPTLGGASGAAGAVPGAAPASGGMSLESLVGSAGKSIAANPLGTALAAGGLGYSILNGQSQLPTTKTLQDQANALNANGQQLMSYLQSGTLPPGMKMSLDQATAAAKAKAIQNYASSGMSADPTKNSALAQQLRMIDQQAIITIADMGSKLMDKGLQSTGMASDLYKTLSNIDQTQQQAIGKSIASFAAALAPSGPRIQIGGAAA